MPRPPVYTQVMDVVERRIAEGDYMLKDIPGERRLADEVGVSYMTARKAVSKLIEKKVLTRTKNGALMVNQANRGAAKVTNVALLTPAYPSTHLIRCRLEITKASEHSGIKLRPVEYMHWYDPIVSEALDASDGLIVVPSTEPIPEHLIQSFAAKDRRVVFFDDDMSEQGITSVCLFAHEHIVELFEFIWSLGHRRIDCLNTQGHNHETQSRIQLWQDWLTKKDGSGELWDDPAAPYTDPVEQAYWLAKNSLLKSDRGPRAVICTTQPAAIGANRACHEAGLVVGQDISICAMNNEPTGRFSTPSMTGLEMPAIAPLLDDCFKWFKSRKQSDKPEAILIPSQANLLKGESTGRV